MEYLRATDDRVEFRVRVAADWQGPLAKQIRDALVGADSAVEEWRTSNRAMWPDTELKGVEFDATGPLTKGKISRTTIEFGVAGDATVEAGYRQLADWFDGTALELPPLEAFYGKMVAVDPADGWEIVDDPSKCDRRDFAGQCMADVEGFEVGYATACMGAYISFDLADVEASVPVDAIADVTAAFLADERFLIVDEAEVERDESPRDGW